MPDAAFLAPSSMKFLSTWLRNFWCTLGVSVIDCLLNEVPEHMAQEWLRRSLQHLKCNVLNEVPEHMAQEFDVPGDGQHGLANSSMKFLSTWLRNGLMADNTIESGDPQ